MTIPDIRMHCRFDLSGTTYEYHGEGLYPEFKQVMDNTGFTLLQLPDAVARGNADALLAVAWLAKRAAGEDPQWAELAPTFDPTTMLCTLEHAPPAEDSAPEPEKPKAPKRAAAVDKSEPAPA